MADTFEFASEYLKAHSILTLATSNDDGSVALSTVDYMWAGKSLFFMTDVRSRKAVNMQKKPVVTIIVTDQDAGFFDAKGVEIYGKVKTTDNPEEIKAYTQHFMTRRGFTSLPPIPDIEKNMRYYEVTPLRMRVFNNAVKPGHVEEINF